MKFQSNISFVHCHVNRVFYFIFNWIDRFDRRQHHNYRSDQVITRLIYILTRFCEINQTTAKRTFNYRKVCNCKQRHIKIAKNMFLRSHLNFSKSLTVFLIRHQRVPQYCSNTVTNNKLNIVHRHESAPIWTVCKLIIITVVATFEFAAEKSFSLTLE